MSTTQSIADRLVELCRQGQFSEAQQELYSREQIVSIEPEGAPMVKATGWDELMEKEKQFQGMVEAFHGVEVSDPVVAGNFFSCTISIDVTYKGAPRMKQEEVAVYEVNDGKIVLEQFFYTQQG